MKLDGKGVREGGDYTLNFHWLVGIGKAASWLTSTRVVEVGSEATTQQCAAPQVRNLRAHSNMTTRQRKTDRLHLKRQF